MLCYFQQRRGGKRRGEGGRREEGERGRGLIRLSGPYILLLFLSCCYTACQLPNAKPARCSMISEMIC